MFLRKIHIPLLMRLKLLSSAIKRMSKCLGRPLDEIHRIASHLHFPSHQPLSRKRSRVRSRLRARRLGIRSGLAHRVTSAQGQFSQLLASDAVRKKTQRLPSVRQDSRGSRRPALLDVILACGVRLRADTAAVTDSEGRDRRRSRAGRLRVSEGHACIVTSRSFD